MANVTTSAETNVITTSQMAKAREIDFNLKFTGTILRKLIEALGVARKIPMIEGTTLYYYNTTGTLQSGDVPEGEIIPLSQYQRNKVAVGEISLKKWRKASTAEAILKSGYDEAVRQTDAKLLTDVQTGIRTDFFDFIKGVDGTVVGASTLQMVLARSWGNLQVLFENDAIEPVHFLHPLTIADYLGSANITVQNVFGFNYIQDFLGLGSIIMTSQIPQGQVFSTAKENLIMYYVPVTADAMKALGAIADDSGYIGINSGYATENRAQVETLVMCGIRFLVEYANGVVIGQIDSTPTLGSITVTSEAGTASGDTKITLSGYSPSAGEKYVYKFGASTAPSVSYGQKLGNTWTEMTSPAQLTPGSNGKITVASVDANGRAQAAGSADVVKNS